MHLPQGQSSLVKSLPPQVWSTGRQHHHLRAFQRCRISGPSPDILSQNRHLNKILRRFVDTGGLEDSCFKAWLAEGGSCWEGLLRGLCLLSGMGPGRVRSVPAWWPQTPLGCPRAPRPLLPPPLAGSRGVTDPLSGSLAFRRLSHLPQVSWGWFFLFLEV